MSKNWPICLLAPLLFAGCVSSKIQQGGTPGAGQQASSIYLAPYHNATPNPTAGRALTDITATSLLAHGMPLVQSESATAEAARRMEDGKPHDMLPVARSINASHTLLCSVHEYRFKSDLDGAPTVGITMRLVDSFSGRTVWQGTGSRAGSYYGSLSQTAQNTIDQLVREMSGQNRRQARTQPRERMAPTYRGGATTGVATTTTSSPTVTYQPQAVAYPAAPVATTVNTWEQSTVVTTPIPVEPEFEQIRRRAPKTAPLLPAATTGAAWAPVPPSQPAPPPAGRYDPIYPSAQPQPVWKTRPN